MVFSKFIFFSLISLICLFFINTNLVANGVKLFKNDVPIQMSSLSKMKSNGILIKNLSKTLDSGKIEKADVVCNVGSEFPKDGGFCSLQYRVSKLFFSKDVTLEFKSTKNSNGHYTMEGRYKIGEDSTEWSAYVTIANFTTSSNATYNLKTEDIKNILTVKKL